MIFWRYLSGSKLWILQVDLKGTLEGEDVASHHCFMDIGQPKWPAFNAWLTFTQPFLFQEYEMHTSVVNRIYI